MGIKSERVLKNCDVAPGLIASQLLAVAQGSIYSAGMTGCSLNWYVSDSCASWFGRSINVL